MGEFLLGVFGVAVDVAAALEVDVGQNQRDNLFAGPEFFRFADGRRGEFAIEIVHVHQQVHDLRASQESASAGEESNAQQGVLHQSHDGAVGLRGHDLPRHVHDLFDFGARFIGLRGVHVHFIAVEIRIVRRGDREVEAEGRVREDAHFVTHHGTTMQGGLTVEDDKVAVDQVALDDHAVVELNFFAVLNVAQVKLFSIVSNYGFGT